MSNIAFIPVRGGSKSIPLKNIKPLNGKPLVYWAAKAANDAACIDTVIIATDCDKIKEAVLSFTDMPKVKIYDRDPINAQDTSSTESVMLEYIATTALRPEDYFFLIQATSPLLKAEHIDSMYNKLLSDKADSALSCVVSKRFFWSADGQSLNYDYKNRPRRQDFAGTLMENGACYISKVGNILESKNRLSGKIATFVMPEYTAVEIDEADDFLIIEKLMRKNIPATLPTDKTFCFDIDGVLGEKADIKDMDGSYANNTPNEPIIKLCNRLYENGNKIVLHTARGSGNGVNWSQITKAQLEKWGVKYHQLTFGKPAADYYVDDKAMTLDMLNTFNNNH